MTVLLSVCTVSAFVFALGTVSAISLFESEVREAAVTDEPTEPTTATAYPQFFDAEREPTPAPDKYSQCDLARASGDIVGKTYDCDNKDRVSYLGPPSNLWCRCGWPGQRVFRESKNGDVWRCIRITSWENALNEITGIIKNFDDCEEAAKDIVRRYNAHKPEDYLMPEDNYGAICCETDLCND